MILKNRYKDEMSKIHVDDDMKKKLQVGIAEGHEYEKDGRSLSKLQLHLKEHH